MTDVTVSDSTVDVAVTTSTVGVSVPDSTVDVSITDANVTVDVPSNDVTLNISAPATIEIPSNEVTVDVSPGVSEISANYLRLDTSNGPLTGGLGLAVGTTSNPPLKFTNGPLTTVAEPGAIEYYDNHWWLTNGHRHVIVRSGNVKTDTTTVTDTTAERVVYTHTFQANELHDDERIVFDMTGVYSNAAASDDFTIRFKIAGDTFSVINREGGNVTDSGWKAIFEGTIRTSGVSGTFVHFTSFDDGDQQQAQADVVEHSIDTTVAVTFEVTVQWDNDKAGNTFSCTQGDLQFRH